jgi:hypothetical protein
MIQLDYNPLRRAASHKTEAARMGSAAGKFGIAKDSSSVSLQLMQTRYDREKEQAEEQKKWGTITGVIQAVGGVALGAVGVATGNPMAVVSGASMVAQGGTNIAASQGAISQGAANAINTGISVASGVTQQFVSYKQQQNQMAAGQAFQQAVASDAADGYNGWDFKDGQLSYTPSQRMGEALENIDKQYGILGSKPGQDAYKAWVGNNSLNGAQQFADQLVQGQQQLIQNAVNGYIDQGGAAGGGNIQQVYDVIDGLGKSPTETAMLKQQTARIANYKDHEIAAQHSVKDDGLEAALKTIEEGGSGAATAALQNNLPSTRNPLDQEYLKSMDNETARALRMSNAINNVMADYEARGESISRQDAAQIVEREAALVEGAKLTPDEKEALKSSITSYNDKFVRETAQATGTLFDATLKDSNGNITDAVAAAENKLENIKSPEARHAAELVVRQKQARALDEQFDLDRAQSFDTEVLRQNVEKYDPKTGNLKAEYTGLSKLHETHWQTLKNELDRRDEQIETAREKAGNKASKAEIEAAQNYVYNMYESWKQGGVPIKSVATAIQQGIADGYIDQKKGNEWIDNMVMGEDGRGKTKDAFNYLRDMLKSADVSVDRQMEIYEIVRGARANGQTGDELVELINTFEKTEMSDFLDRALAGIEAKKGVEGKDIDAFIDAGSNGGLDPYSEMVYDPKTGKDERVIAGEDTSMNALRNTMGQQIKKRMKDTIQLWYREDVDPGEPVWYTDETGDEKGFFAFKVGGDTVRLALNKDKKFFGLGQSDYVIEKLENGTWKEEQMPGMFGSGKKR